MSKQVIAPTVARSTVARIACCPHCTNVNKFMNKNLPTDHWLRETTDPKSPVICKELLSTECRFCRKLGHTKTQCPELVEKNRLGQQPQQQSQQQPLPKTIPPVSKNRFDCLQDDDEVLPKNKMDISTNEEKSRIVSKKVKLDMDYPEFGSKRTIMRATMDDVVDTVDTTVDTVDTKMNFATSDTKMNFAKAVATLPSAPPAKVVIVLPLPILEQKQKVDYTKMGVFTPLTLANRSSWADTDSDEDDLDNDGNPLEHLRTEYGEQTRQGRVNSWGDLSEEDDSY
jgi:hypothetical protein